MALVAVDKLWVTVTKSGLRLGKSFRAFCSSRAVAPKLIKPIQIKKYLNLQIAKSIR